MPRGRSRGSPDCAPNQDRFVQKRIFVGVSRLRRSDVDQRFSADYAIETPQRPALQTNLLSYCNRGPRQGREAGAHYGLYCEDFSLIDGFRRLAFPHQMRNPGVVNSGRRRFKSSRQNRYPGNRGASTIFILSDQYRFDG